MRGGAFRIVVLVVLAHVALLGLLLFRPTKEILPRANQPWLPDPEPKDRFAVGEFTFIDPKTGEKYRETRYVVSTRLFMQDAGNSSPSKGPAEAKDKALAESIHKP
ncbi:MAG: hypothetical protein SNJ52_04390 [Verrucomicrobiia bacterium]